MLKKKSSSSEKKRKHSRSEERQESSKRRSLESQPEDTKDELADPELDRIGSDIEEGGLDLSVPFKPITAYIGDKKEMLGQCFRVLGDKKLQKMLPDEFKNCSLKEIQDLCWEQLEPIPEDNLLQILAGEELMAGCENSEGSPESQQDNNVDSTSYNKETPKAEDPKQEAGASGEESDVLSINVDAYDSDIEGLKEEQSVRVAVKASGAPQEQPATPTPTPGSAPAAPAPTPDPAPINPAPRKDIQSDIDRSVSEILAPPSNPDKKEFAETNASTHTPDATGPAPPSCPASVCQPSAQQLELLELEMRARAIKALMKASNGKICPATNIKDP